MAYLLLSLAMMLVIADHLYNLHDFGVSCLKLFRSPNLAKDFQVAWYDGVQYGVTPFVMIND